MALAGTSLLVRRCAFGRIAKSLPAFTMYKRSVQSSASPLIFRQLFEHKSFTFTYVLGDPESMEAILIDPVLEMVERDKRILEQLGLKLKYAANTHCHADHVTGSGQLKRDLPDCKSVIAKASGAMADIYLEHGDSLEFGNKKLEARSTPGHTDGCMTYVLHEDNMVFTGDAVLVRGCGRTDFQQGDPEVLYKSIYREIFSLPPETSVYPGHDYTGQSMSTVEEEKQFNPRLTKPIEQFVKIMKNLNLPYPKQIERAIPANLKCGLFDLDDSGEKPE